jgi:hypothetical protein
MSVVCLLELFTQEREAMMKITMTIPYLVASLLLPNMAYAMCQATRVCVMNNSSTTYYITGGNTQDQIWEDCQQNLHDRPDFNWVAFKLDPGEIKCLEEDLNSVQAANNPSFSFFTDTTGLATGNTPGLAPGVETKITYDYSSKKWLSNATAGHRPSDTPPGQISGTPSQPYQCYDTNDPLYNQCSMFHIDK